MEAPPSLKGQLLRIYSHTGAPDARALLRDHLTHRYRLVRMLETCFALWLQCSPAGARRLYREQRGTGEPLSSPWG